MAARVLTREGLAALEAELSTTPGMDRIQRHEAIAAAIEIHAKPDVMDDDVIYPEIGTRLIDSTPAQMNTSPASIWIAPAAI